MDWRLRASLLLMIVALICGVALLLSGCGAPPTGTSSTVVATPVVAMPGQQFIDCVDYGQRVIGQTGSEAKTGCGGWR